MIVDGRVELKNIFMLIHHYVNTVVRLYIEKHGQKYFLFCFPANQTLSLKYMKVHWALNYCVMGIRLQYHEIIRTVDILPTTKLPRPFNLLRMCICIFSCFLLKGLAFFWHVKNSKKLYILVEFFTASLDSLIFDVW